MSFGPNGRVSTAIIALALGFALASASCHTDGPIAVKYGAPPPPKEAGIRPFGPSRYVEQSSRWIERAASGLDHVILNGRRTELKGTKVVRSAVGEPDVDSGAVMPPWVKGPARYVFWKGRDVYAAATFLGDLVKVTTLPSDVGSAPFDWIDGIGLSAEAGALVIVPGTAADLRDVRWRGLPVPGGVDGLAADEKRAVAMNVFGHALLTIDGGKTFRDVTEELGDVKDYDVRGNDLVISNEAGRDQFIAPDGKIADSATAPGPLRGSPPPDLDDTWAVLSSADAQYSLASSAIPLGDGTILVASDGKIAKLDAATARVISATTLEDTDGDQCLPVKLPDAVVLACTGGSRAMIIDVTGVPKVERTFELDGDGNGGFDTFSVADGVGIGYLGPCAGVPVEREDVDSLSGASQRNQSPQRSPVFCARAGADHWIEHRLDAEDAQDAIGWMARPGGDAVALIARAGRFVAPEDRVTNRGPLRIVRIPRMEPPLSMSGYSSRSADSLSRDMRANPDGSIEAWITSNNYGNSNTSAVIDAEGHVRVRPTPPRVDGMQASGPFALAHSDDGRMFETVDWGKRWVEVPLPPGSAQNARPSECSAVGCSVAGYLRIGWDSVDTKLPAAAADYETGRAKARVLREKYEYRRPLPEPPVVKLACSYASPGEGARQPDSYGFGFTAAATGYSGRGGGSSRLGWVGAVTLPWWQGPMPSGMDVDLAWVEPFDLDGKIHRATVPLSHAGLSLSSRPYEVRLGYVMDEEGRVDLLPTGSKELCLGALLEEAGVVAKVGGCVEDPAIGIRIKDRIIVGSARWSGYAIVAIDLPHAADGVAAVGSAQRELRLMHGSASMRGFTVGIGARAGLPVGVAVNGRGEAVLAPIDPNDGYIGEAEALAPLSGLKVGTDSQCPTSDKLGAGEGRVLLPFDTAIGLSRLTLPGVSATGSAGVAVVRWSKDWACLEAVEMNVRDERFDPDGNNYEQAGTLRKLVARFTKAPPRRGLADKKAKAPVKKSAAAASASASASASAAASAAAAAIPPWASPYAAPPLAPSASASASAVATVAPIPVAPPPPKGAGEATLVLIQYGSEVRQRLFCTGTTP